MMSEMPPPLGLGGGGGVGGGGGPAGGGGEGDPQHWLWQPGRAQYGAVLPHHPHWLQQSPPGQSAPPAWLPHCSAEAPPNSSSSMKFESTSGGILRYVTAQLY